MPFPTLSKTKPKPDTRPLLHAQSQSPSTPSLAPSSTSTTANAANDADTDTNPPNHKNDENTDDNPSRTENSPITRPKTPPQSSNHLPWTSYHNLPPDHPVFRYPDDVREKMYAKGVGTCLSSHRISAHPGPTGPPRSADSFMFDLTRPSSQSRNGPRAPGQGVRRAPPPERVLEEGHEHDGAVWEYC